jgi:hypothetical protein
MIKFTYRELSQMADSIDALLNIKLPVKDSYNLALAANTLRDKFSTYEQSRQALVRKYGDFIQSENVIKVKQENMEKFTHELEGLMSQTVELSLEPISVGSLGDNKMTAKDMALLAPFFCA